MNRSFCGKLRLNWNTVAAILMCASFLTIQAQTNTVPGEDTGTNSPVKRPASPRRPSIILIFADNVGYGDLGCYGQTRIKTPNLDKLATNGIRFTSFYAGSPSDEPSRASLLTGLEPRHVGASFSHPLPMDAVTIGTFLKEQGYRTGFIGEWNLGDTAPVKPSAKGFDEFAGYLNQSHARDYFTETLYRQDPLTHYDDLSMLAPESDNKTFRYVPDILGSSAVRFLKNSKPSRLNNFRPFFLCVSYPIPHFSNGPTNSYNGESWPLAAKMRATLITRMDENIGQMLDQLKTSQMDTNTIVLFTSVGGPKTEGPMDAKFFDSAGHLRGEAGSVYEGGLRVPLIASWPAAIKPQQTNDLVWAAWDLFPTFAEIALAKAPEKSDGLSAMSAFGGHKPKRQHESLYWQSSTGAQAIRSGEWKLIRNGTNTVELYNLAADIGEKTNVIGKNSSVAKRLEDLLDKTTAK